jgi:hypothetical protein
MTRSLPLGSPNHGVTILVSRLQEQDLGSLSMLIAFRIIHQEKEKEMEEIAKIGLIWKFLGLPEKGTLRRTVMNCGKGIFFHLSIFISS